ncbi:molybdopterin-guanine dinucleotide biosynthesis protein B [Listeria aquatica]|uniref:Molybdopterin-guanine dinucleotide biosynthesis protein B n=1 Tax=Listeria aquatica TaxID=1494960 RepID=A0A841ZKL2_9LIST|nr:molybdopterin-guanine dinucleotide biosynthesis protein B [Listeria aquatica]MBC1520643.1 molybdopterin-guanine dinucleotide biosynthesis protein B [Listeria aquatica]
MAAILQVVGYKKSGKTTFMNQLIQQAKEKGFTVAALKHDAHDFDMDHPGTDSFSFRESGADHVAFTSNRQFALLSHTSLSLKQALERLPQTDLVVIEGFKDASFPKVVFVKSLEEYVELKTSLTEVLAFASFCPLANEHIQFIAEDEKCEQLAESLIEEFLI